MKKLIAMMVVAFPAAMTLMAATETVGSCTWTDVGNGGAAENVV